VTTALPGQSPATQIDLAKEQLRQQADKARKTAKAVFRPAMAAIVADGLKFMSLTTWCGDDKRLRDLVHDTNIHALDVRVVRRLAELHPDLYRSLVDDVLRSLLDEEQKKQGKAA
jgi:hypothetical protein